LGVKIVAIAPDAVELLQAAREEKALGYELYSDVPMNSGMAMGIAYQVQKPQYLKMLAERLGGEEFALPVPSAFLLNAESKIVFSYVNPDHKERIPAALVLSAVKELIVSEED
jgi:peroxiredoxin